ncbi:hypothetical protein ACFQFC_10805 [Amorphoplanes digitatis]|uniref:Uncharacterized protein n=1 Tax=Actinoplanes digitatis TaxID=1868 RepID=A0A7W7I1K4_9ACTN|nr:hypothetical protein [Actinoplanes digitatis]MBB4764687.1 hypothetical protein [Actinoplanes digitatis]BFE74233.1 hypothetical protein GCM10020092_075340 [Actinoplanes digitatis]GID91361.1 hypothetical protein Adi01nite_07730 [Actinoplanes digitatis]
MLGAGARSRPRLLSPRQAADAHRRMEAGRLRGRRVLLLPDERAGT